MFRGVTVLKAATVFVRSLESAGITHIFGLPGEENLELLNAIAESSIAFVTVRDEQTAVFMAATVGRLTGRVGVALSTLGPGATNLVTGVAFAQLGAMPLLVITGQKPIKKSKQGKFQIIDVVGMMKPITKMAETIVGAEKIPTTVHQAMRLAELERPGAVHLELPEDIADEETDAQVVPWQKVRRPIPDQKSIAMIVSAIEAAKSPIIILGASANRKLIRKQMDNFVGKTGIPFLTTQMGKGAMDEGSDLFIGTTALSDGDFVHKALESADLIIMIGHDIVEKPPTLGRANQTFAHINFYPADFDDVYRPAYEVIGDISHALWAMSELITPQTWDFGNFLDIRERLLTQIQESATDMSFPIKPQTFVRALRENMPRDGILSLDNGMYKLWIARNYPAYEQNTVLLDNALATMGAGLGVGMAAKLLNPDKKVVVVAGDGGFMMNLADLETAKRLELNLVIIILKDNGYGMIKWKQKGMHLESFGLNFTNPDFVMLAESFGAMGYKLSSVNEFTELLPTVLEQPGIHILDVAVDYSENTKLDKEQLSKLINN